MALHHKYRFTQCDCKYKMVAKVFFILIIATALVVQAKYLTESEKNNYNDNPIVQSYREYIRIDTSNPDNICEYE